MLTRRLFCIRPVLRLLSTNIPMKPPETFFEKKAAKVEPSEKVLQTAATLEDSRMPSISDAKYIFEKAWNRVEKAYGGSQNLRFPNEIIWLMGAPASGKGSNTPAILAARGITNPPIVVSRLLRDPETKRLIDSGQMVDDTKVVELLLKAMLHCDQNVGVLVDGFPRTEVQVECLKLLHEKLQDLRTQYFNTTLREQFRRPIFRIMVLYVEESESIKRQVKRGMLVKEHNERVRKTGQGELLPERITDSDENLIRARYKVFTQHYGALMRLKSLFPFHLIHASGTIDEVIRAIWREFEYQSSLELDQQTYDMIQSIPIATKVGLHGRQKLVRRLEQYQATAPETLGMVIKLIREQFIPVIEQHAISGSLLVRTEDQRLNEPYVVDMILDVLSERGFRVSVDKRVHTIPVRVNKETMEIISEKKSVYIFDVSFPKHQIRGVFGGDDIREFVGDVASTESLGPVFSAK